MIDFGYGIRLEPMNSGCLDGIRAWRNDPRIWVWCRQNDLITDVAQKRWFEKMSSDPTTKMYMIGKDHSQVGVCGFTSIDLYSRRAEFSLYIGPEHQKQGYAKAALKTLFKHGFGSLGFNIIWGETFDGNPALGLFIRLGMKHEGTRREFYFKNGEFINANLVSIKRDELLC